MKLEDKLKVQIELLEDKGYQKVKLEGYQCMVKGHDDWLIVYRLNEGLYQFHAQYTRTK